MQVPRASRGLAPFLRCPSAADGFRSYGDRLLSRSPCRGSGAFLSDEAVRAGAAGGLDRLNRQNYHRKPGGVLGCPQAVLGRGRGRKPKSPAFSPHGRGGEGEVPDFLPCKKSHGMDAAASEVEGL